MNLSEKIQATHLKRKAILYIRQSTMRQVVMNTESTMRQYALKERLTGLGWDDCMIEIIDCDLGHSGAEATGRDGFRQMLADVAEGNVGGIACIECSRLSRSSGDWGRLMEICALSGTILIDDDGVYDPNNFNDRLLLGLKGTMSEAELHFLRERMRGGALNKAKRGALRCLLPIGYLYDEAGDIIKDPDIQIQSAIALFFESFRICGSAHNLAVYYGEKGYLFPTNKNRGFGKPDIEWRALTPTKAIKVLHSPTYAGVYSYGKIQVKNTVKGKKLRPVPEEQWVSNIENHHDAYITLEDYRTNVAILYANRTNNASSAPREGDSLIQGIAFCARCGTRMLIACDGAGSRRYICQHKPKYEPYSYKLCLSVNGRTVDNVVSEAVLRRLTPEAVKAAADVFHELEKRKHSEDNYFAMQVEKAKYETDLARKRYMNADSENRLVCAELERLWNEKITQLAQAELEMRKHNAVSNTEPTRPDMERLFALPEKLNNAWSSNALGLKDKKRIIRNLVQDVALNMVDDQIQIGITFRGGMTEFITVPRPLSGVATDTETLEYIREASKKYTAEDIAESLNRIGRKTGTGLEFTMLRVRGVQQHNGILSFTQYLHSEGYLSTADKAKQLGISQSALNSRRIKGEFDGAVVKTSKSGDYMFIP